MVERNILYTSFYYLDIVILMDSSCTLFYKDITGLIEYREAYNYNRYPDIHICNVHTAPILFQSKRGPARPHCPYITRIRIGSAK